jgi:hypothetical protein
MWRMISSNIKVQWYLIMERKLLGTLDDVSRSKDLSEISKTLVRVQLHRIDVKNKPDSHRRPSRMWMRSIMKTHTEAVLSGVQDGQCRCRPFLNAFSRFSSWSCRANLRLLCVFAYPDTQGNGTKYWETIIHVTKHDDWQKTTTQMPRKRHQECVLLFHFQKIFGR